MTFGDGRIVLSASQSAFSRTCLRRMVTYTMLSPRPAVMANDRYRYKSSAGRRYKSGYAATLAAICPLMCASCVFSSSITFATFAHTTGRPFNAVASVATLTPERATATANGPNAKNE